MKAPRGDLRSDESSVAGMIRPIQTDRRSRHTRTTRDATADTGPTLTLSPRHRDAHALYIETVTRTAHRQSLTAARYAHHVQGIQRHRGSERDRGDERDDRDETERHACRAAIVRRHPRNVWTRSLGRRASEAHSRECDALCASTHLFPLLWPTAAIDVRGSPSCASPLQLQNHGC